MCLSWWFLVIVYIYANHFSKSRMTQDSILPSDGGLKQTPNLTCSYYPGMALHHLLSSEISLAPSTHKILATTSFLFVFNLRQVISKWSLKNSVIVMAFYSRVTLFMSANSTNDSCPNEPLTAKIRFHQMGMLHQERACL